MDERYDLDESADATFRACVDACLDVAGEVEREAIVELAWNILTADSDFSKVVEPEEMEPSVSDRIGLALRIGVAIGLRLGETVQNAHDVSE
jgi:hypothetical protein